MWKAGENLCQLFQEKEVDASLICLTIKLTNRSRHWFSLVIPLSCAKRTVLSRSSWAAGATEGGSGFWGGAAAEVKWLWAQHTSFLGPSPALSPELSIGGRQRLWRSQGARFGCGVGGVQVMLEPEEGMGQGDTRGYPSLPVVGEGGDGAGRDGSWE